MSGSDIVSTLNLLIKLGSELKIRLDSFHQAAEDLQLLTTSLALLLKIFENPMNEKLMKAHESEFVNILDILQSIAHTCAKGSWQKFVQRIRAFNKIPDLLAEIRRKAQQLEKVYGAVSATILNDIREQKKPTNTNENIECTAVVQTSLRYKNMLDIGLSSDFASIDQMVGNLMRECQHLHQRLQEATIFPDTPVIQDYQIMNPEGAAFWKDRFQRDKLNASALRYETLYVSWARFVHEVETSFMLKRIPTAIFRSGNVDDLYSQGSYFDIDQRGSRHLSTIRPLWLPALRFALDPLHKGYVKPQDYFNLLQDFSLSETLRRLVFETAGYGTLVECKRESADIPLPAELECPSDHVGWITAQIVSVPTLDDLGIVTDQEVLESASKDMLTYFSDVTQDVHVYVRYLQTGQIERKSLSKRLRPIGGISVGATLSIRHGLESGGFAWSGDLCITEFKALYGGKYILTAGAGSTSTVFSTRPLKTPFNTMLRDDESSSASTIPELDCVLLGPSKTFVYPPKVGEKVQIEYAGLWHDSRVTAVDGDEIEYVDWGGLPEQIPTNGSETQGRGSEDEDDSGGFFFSEEQLTQLGKGRRRIWCPWRKGIRKYDVRPYRCFHIGDSVEAPVMYPDFRFHYHILDNSTLYLPARIVDVQGDQYVIEFNPALSVHSWWPGRMPQGTQVELVPGSGIKAENPFDFNRVITNMDQVRPFSAGPRPVLGVQSAKPVGWSSFQGVHLRSLEDLLEQSLWSDSYAGQQASSD